MPAREVRVQVGDRELTLSNLDKVFYASTGFTKRDLIDYYRRIAPAILPHLRGRPLTLKRYPDGAAGQFFYEKRCPKHRPDWVRTAEVPREGGEEAIRFCVAGDLPTLTWAANLAAIELHPALHREPELDRPTALVLDLDPGPPADVLQCCELALLLREVLGRLRLETFVKTSGSKGLQLYAPLNVPVTYDETKAFARALAEGLAARRPALVVAAMKKALRHGKVLVDWSQNDRHKTTVCVWSLRARERPTVSTPVSWDEVREAVEDGTGERLVFEAEAALRRHETQGDLFAPVETKRQRLPPLGALESALEDVAGEGTAARQQPGAAPRRRGARGWISYSAPAQPGGGER